MSTQYTVLTYTAGHVHVTVCVAVLSSLDTSHILHMLHAHHMRRTVYIMPTQYTVLTCNAGHVCVTVCVAVLLSLDTSHI